MALNGMEKHLSSPEDKAGRHSWKRSRYRDVHLEGKEKILRLEEIEKGIARALSGSIYKIDVEKTVLLRDACLLSLFWLFGKRRNEVIRLKRGDIDVDLSFITIWFNIEKKTKRVKECPSCKRNVSRKAVVCGYCRTEVGKVLDKVVGKARTIPKQINRKHPITRYITNYLEALSKDKNTSLFPAGQNSRRRLPHMSGHRAWEIIIRLIPHASPHLFRHALATLAAEHRATEDQLMAWFDWDDPKTAHGYVKRGSTLTEEMSKREW